ncbi:serine/threonine protein kinase, partial [Anabaena catenula FACHB-362]|nr:serine/threonine protein kinase [Anabaena catenula FACHB-362]
DFSETVLEFKANRLGEKITQSFTVKNPIPDTLLEGRWEVAPHPQDPPHTPDNHAWISVTPAQFSRNNIRCQVEVDTSKLMADKQYKRQLILNSNAYPASHTLTVKVQTAALPIEKSKINYWSLMGWFSISAVVSMAMSGFCIYYTVSIFWLWWSGIVGFLYAALIYYSELEKGKSVSVALGKAALSFVSTGVISVLYIVPIAVYGAFYGTVYGAVIWAVIYGVYKVFFGRDINKSFIWFRDLAENSFTAVLILLVLGFGISVGTGIIIGFLNPFILLALTGTSLPTLSMLLYPPLKRRKLIAKYRQSEESLIKP